MADSAWSHQPATCTASAVQASVDNTVRTSRGVPCPAWMEESASKTHPTHSSTAAAAPLTSPDDSVRDRLYHAPVPIGSVSSRQEIKCVMINAITTNASGMEETALSAGCSLGLTAPPVFPAGISLRMDDAIRSVTTPSASLTALNARRLQQPSASMRISYLFSLSCSSKSLNTECFKTQMRVAHFYMHRVFLGMTSTAQTTMVTVSVTRAASQRLVAGTASTVPLTFLQNWQLAHWSLWYGCSPRSCLATWGVSCASLEPCCTPTCRWSWMKIINQWCYLIMRMSRDKVYRAAEARESWTERLLGKFMMWHSHDYTALFLYISCFKSVANLMLTVNWLLSHLCLCSSVVHLEIDNRKCTQSSSHCFSDTDEVASFIAAAHIKADLPYPLVSVRSK